MEAGRAGTEYQVESYIAIAYHHASILYLERQGIKPEDLRRALIEAFDHRDSPVEHPTDLQLIAKNVVEEEIEQLQGHYGFSLAQIIEGFQNVHRTIQERAQGGEWG